MTSAQTNFNEDLLVPYAIFWRPIIYFSLNISTDTDDLDTFKFAKFKFFDEFSFQMRTYRGEPQETTTLYLHTDIKDYYHRDPVSRVIEETAIPRTSLAWKRGETFEFGKLDRNPADRLRERESRVLFLKIASASSTLSASTSHIKRTIPQYTHLSDADRVISQTRKNEHLWLQIAGNVISHLNSKDNIFYRGLAIRTDDGIQITEKGLNYLKSIGFLSNS